MDRSEVFKWNVSEHRQVLEALVAFESEVQRAAEILIHAIQNGKAILLAGNGGSASDAQHIAGEFVGRYLLERAGAAAIALGASDAALTSIGNDYGFEQVFSRQVEAFRLQAGAVVLYSTSGNSPNILRAAQTARQLQIPVIGMTGETGGKLSELCDVCIKIPSKTTPRIQEMHALVGHILCEMVESSIPKSA
ncbi:MAG TPA: SIS domain-containing protein [Fimbriimonadaceae bacterium]|nr:SIS domain-containing protein [Fimbriimonadaceae bacterium]